MAEIKVQVKELKQLQVLILGATDQATGNVVCPGFVNETKVTEGMKRKANRIGKKITEELEEAIKQLTAIAAYKEDGKSEEELEIIKKQKEIDLLEEELTIAVDDLLDFTRIEDLTLGYGYQLLYDKIFIN